MENSPSISITRAERDFALLWARRVVLLFLAVAVFSQLEAFFSRKFYSNTGRAEWIWLDHRFASGDPAAFFATRNFTLPERRDAVKIKVAGDPEYTIYFNGVEIGGDRDEEERALDVYDVSALARTGSNRIVAALRSGNGVGGFLLSVDSSRTKENILVTDASWKIWNRWDDQLLLRDPASAPLAPRIIGSPPVGRWNFLSKRARDLVPEMRTVLYPVSSESFQTSIPEVRTISGVAIVVPRPARATAFDFGPVRGRGRIEVKGEHPGSILVRFANAPSELREQGKLYPFVFATGETAVTDSEERSFRYVVVYDATAEASVLQTVR